jgi:hypothetical protein
MDVLNVSLLLSILELNSGNIGIITVEDSGDLFKSGTLGFDVEEEDEDELDSDPDLCLISMLNLMTSECETYSVEAPEVPVVGKVLESDGVGLVANGKSNLDEEVHDHETSSTESEGADFQSVGDDQTGPSNGVTDVKEPDESNLRVSQSLDLGFTAGFEASGDNCPDEEEEEHS